MVKKILDIIGNEFELNELEVGEFKQFKAKGMKFDIQAYHANGLGHVSVMKAVGFFGLMKMDTVIVVPKEKDLPLYSYDRIYVMGNDTLIVELYNTMVNESDFSSLDEIKNKYHDISERDPGVHWYDSIKLSQSISKKAKKKSRDQLDLLALEHLKSYLSVEVESLSEVEKKHELSARYVDGLLEHGGPSTDVFVKMFGLENTKKLYKEILFGTN